MVTFPRINIKTPIRRLINSRWPTVGLFDELADDEDELRILFDLEMRTNPRNQPAAGRLAKLPAGEILNGPTAHMAMAAFVHCHEDGGRFNSGTLGAWYASLKIETAIEETVYHITRRLSMSEGGFPQQMQMRELLTTVDVPLWALCGAQSSHPELYLSDDYGPSQQFADQNRWPFKQDGIDGLCYDSLRHQGGVNICIYRPTVLKMPLIQGDHYQYNWDTSGNVSVAKLTAIR